MTTDERMRLEALLAAVAHSEDAERILSDAQARYDRARGGGVAAAWTEVGWDSQVWQ